ncbi:MAG: ABC transporter permease [Lachnospiraceae bacterium]|nr:ABC transporter permease [Lachnospiraceae bacterium]
MKHLRTLGYCIKQGFSGLWKNRLFSLASIATVMACLTLIGAFYFVYLNVDSAILKAESSVGMTVFFDDGVEEKRIEEIREKLLKLDEISEVRYISAEEAWEKYKKENMTEEMAASFGDDNPLEESASLEIYLRDGDAGKNVADSIRDISGVRTVNFSETVSERLSDIRALIIAVATVLIGMLAAVSFFLIRTTIATGINVRKEEISIMSIIGATDLFMELPFVVEGILIGLFGGVIPLIILNFSYNIVENALRREFGNTFDNFNLLPKAEVMGGFLPVALLFSVGIGFLASWITAMSKVRKIAVEHF